MVGPYLAVVSGGQNELVQRNLYKQTEKHALRNSKYNSGVLKLYFLDESLYFCGFSFQIYVYVRFFFVTGVQTHLQFLELRILFVENWMIFLKLRTHHRRKHIFVKERLIASTYTFPPSRLHPDSLTTQDANGHFWLFYGANVLLGVSVGARYHLLRMRSITAIHCTALMLYLSTTLILHYAPNNLLHRRNAYADRLISHSLQWRLPHIMDEDAYWLVSVQNQHTLHLTTWQVAMTTVILWWVMNYDINQWNCNISM